MQIERKIIKSLLLTVMMLIFIYLPETAYAKENGVNYTYINEDGSAETKYADNVTVIDDNNIVINLKDGWYVVRGEVTIDESVTVRGEVHLILADGCKLTVRTTDKYNAGINVAEGNSLSIYGQSIYDPKNPSSGDNIGQLFVDADSIQGAGIGGRAKQKA